MTAPRPGERRADCLPPPPKPTSWCVAPVGPLAWHGMHTESAHDLYYASGSSDLGNGGSSGPCSIRCPQKHAAAVLPTGEVLPRPDRQLRSEAYWSPAEWFMQIALSDGSREGTVARKDEMEYRYFRNLQSSRPAPCGSLRIVGGGLSMIRGL